MRLIVEVSRVERMKRGGNVRLGEYKILYGISPPPLSLSLLRANAKLLVNDE